MCKHFQLSFNIMMYGEKTIDRVFNIQHKINTTEISP